MNTIPIKVKESSQLPDCWLYPNKQYLFRSLQLDRLPQLSKSYEFILKDLKIAYRISVGSYGVDILEYWDSSNYQEREITLPLYVCMEDGTYKYVKNYTGKVPTQNSIEAAQMLIEEVIKAVDEYDRKMIKENHVLELKSLLRAEKQ